MQPRLPRWEASLRFSRVLYQLLLTELSRRISVPHENAGIYLELGHNRLFLYTFQFNRLFTITLILATIYYEGCSNETCMLIVK